MSVRIRNAFLSFATSLFSLHRLDLWCDNRLCSNNGGLWGSCRCAWSRAKDRRTKAGCGLILDPILGMDNGLTAAREISRATPTIAIVLCTMFATAALERESQKFGIQAVVDKINAGTQLVGVAKTC